MNESNSPTRVQMRGGWQIIRVVECGSSGSWNNRVFWRKCGWKSTFWSPLGKTNPPTPSKKFLRMFGLKKKSTLSARFLSVSVTKFRVLSFLLFTFIWAVKTFSDLQGSGMRILRVVELQILRVVELRILRVVDFVFRNTIMFVYTTALTQLIS